MSAPRPAETRPPLVRDELPMLAGLMAVSAAFLLWMLLADRTYFAFPDNSEQFWPWYQKAASVLHSGALPLWDANTVGGHSFVGETQTGVFYPLNLLWLLVLGSGEGIGATRLDALVVLHTAIASTGFALLARQFNISRPAAFGAALVVAFTGSLYARSTGQTAIFFGLALLPWALLFAVRYLEGGRLRSALASGGVLGLAILAGHFQPALHGALTVGLLLVLTLPLAGTSRRDYLVDRARGLAGVVAGLLIVSLPQIAYSLPYLARAYRFTSEPTPTGPGDAISFTTFVGDFAGSPEWALGMLNPQVYPVPDGNDLYLGLASLVVIGVAFAAFGRQALAPLGRYRLAVLGFGLFGLLAVLGAWTPAARILHTLPLLAQVRELGRYAIMIHLALGLVLAASLHQLLAALARSGDAERRERARRALLVGGVLILVNAAYLWAEGTASLTPWFAAQLALAGGAALVIAGGLRTPASWVAPSLVAVLGLTALASAARPTGLTSAPLYPPNDFARTSTITALEQGCSGHRTLVLDDAVPRNFADVFRKIRTHNGFGATMHVPYYDFISTQPIDPTQSAMLDLRCVVAKTTDPPPGYRLLHRDPNTNTTVYRKPSTSPLNTPDAKPVRARTLIEGDRVRRFEVNLDAPTTVVVSSIVYPGWKLTVDGRDAGDAAWELNGEKIFPQTEVPAGRHVIEWSWSGLPR